MLRRAIIVAFGSLLLTASCAPKALRLGSAELTNAEMRSASREADVAGQELRKERYPEALTHAIRAESLAPTNAWAHYDRAVALHGLGKTDAAVAAYRDAERAFSDDRRGRAIAIYGRARALQDVGSCDEATTAYEQYASFVRAFNAPAADMALEYAKHCRPPVPITDGAMSRMVTSVITGHYADALKVGERVEGLSRDSGWFDYDRAVAFAGLAHTDDAIAAYRAAEARFGTDNPHGRAIAIYGRALALENAGRCAEAKGAYEEFASFVRREAPRDASMAMAAARFCGSVWPVESPSR